MKQTRLKRVSKKQSKINRELSKKRKELIEWMKDEYGYTFCQECGRTTPQYGLELVHRKGRGRGGADLGENIAGLWCNNLARKDNCHYGPKMGDHYQE